MCSKKKTKRMDKPLDSLAKRQAAYAGDVIHEFFELPGKYVGPLANEYPNASGSVPRVDSSYLAKIGEKICVVNREDESGKVNNETYEKINRYRVNLEYATELPVMSFLTSDQVPSISSDVIHRSPTLICNPKSIVYSDLGGMERLINVRDRILNNEVLDNVDAMNLIMIPRMYKENQNQILEIVCQLLKLLKIEDEEFKLELIFEMKCVIHKYAKTLKDIQRLEEVIGLQEAKTAMDFQKQLIFNEGFDSGVLSKESLLWLLKLRRNLVLKKL
ncbi:hypothetical protein [uncultured Methanobrevibacter sp.]|uniref:hypothetical protein n=1 Tax=uncultured Methanobrevibacter sp. TaxID=253161 RepID=UPI0025ED6662|nr:hypothetical protein [uncultured Methanobrevibacter sp.]